ncbi:MAG: hypothetical protein MN733_41290 [Nitrososphaera sp.]|nr:hypothetical protein [Nitrososphaera sp.]
MKPVTVDCIVEVLTGPLFPGWLGLLYLFGKLLMRHAVHRLVGHDYDAWAVMCWTFVDMAVLSLSLCIGFRVPLRYGFNDNGLILWYIFLAFFMFLATYFYGMFMKRRLQVPDLPPYRDLKMSMSITCSWFFGLACLFPTMHGLAK